MEDSLLLISIVISILSAVVALIALIHSMNTKKYELTCQRFNEILHWHNDVVELLILLRLTSYDNDQKVKYLSKLSSLIEHGRFYFPNIDKNDGFGMDKPTANQGYRSVILDFLVFEYNIFQKNDYKKYSKHAENLQKLFTSKIYEYLDPKKHNKQINFKTSISNSQELSFEDFLRKSSDEIFKYFD